MFQATLTFYENLDFLYNYWHRNEGMLQFFMDISLKPHAKFHEAPIKNVVRTNYLKFDFSNECVPPSCYQFRAFMFSSFQIFKYFKYWCKLL